MEPPSKNERKSRPWLVKTLLVVLVVVSCPAVYVLISQIPFVYYWHFNHIKSLVETLPDTKIIDFWRHEDISLEDFGFELQIRQNQPIRLDFYEGEDWYRNFKKIHGILFSKPYNPASNNYETTPVSRKELARAGIRVSNLADVISQWEKIEAYFRSRPKQSRGVPGVGGHFVRIYYDLDAYKDDKRFSVIEPDRHKPGHQLPSALYLLRTENE